MYASLPQLIALTPFRRKSVLYKQFYVTLPIAESQRTLKALIYLVAQVFSQLFIDAFTRIDEMRLKTCILSIYKAKANH